MHVIFVLTTADRGDLDYILHNMAFHQGLQCLLRQNGSSEEKTTLYLEIVACDPLNYTMDHFKFIASIQKEEFISALRIIQQQSLELHVHDETPNLENSLLILLTELNL